MLHLITDARKTYIHQHKYLAGFAIIWFAFWVINSLTSFKTFSIGSTLWSVGTLTYPIVYIFNDIFTEVYGYRISRKVIWSGFVAFFLMSLVSYVYSFVPGDSGFMHSAEFNFVFRSSPLLVLTSMLAFSSGEFINSFILAKMKVRYSGKKEGLRYIASTFFGQLIDNSIFNLSGVLLLGWYEWKQFLPLTITVVLFCTTWEIIMLPITKKVINVIKNKEGIDTYDIGTNFNPLSSRNFNE